MLRKWNISTGRRRARGRRSSLRSRWRRRPVGVGWVMVALPKIPAPMSVAEFLTWDAPDGRYWQLVDGEPQAMAPASDTHGAIQSELARLIGNHVAGRPARCRIITARASCRACEPTGTSVSPIWLSVARPTRGTTRRSMIRCRSSKSSHPATSGRPGAMSGHSRRCRTLRKSWSCGRRSRARKCCGGEPTEAGPIARSKSATAI